MGSPRAAQLLDGKELIAGVEKQSIGLMRRIYGFLDGRRITNMDDLDERDAGKRLAKLRQGPRRQAIA